ncbi:MAG: hypothetical protein ACFFCY_18205, partial [Promethearchaeota archaeon]
DDKLPEMDKEKIIVFQYNDQLNEFQELELADDIEIPELLDPDFVLLFVDPTRYRVWIWHGSNTTTRMKFIAAKLAPSIRDKYGIGFKISAVDEGNETVGFKVAAGIEKEPEYVEVQTGPSYEGTEEDLALLETLSTEKILLLLEKAGIPEGYERKIIIVNNKVYGYKEYDRNYLGSVIKEKKLFPLKEEIEDGPYLAEDYIPRILFSFNNAILIELLKQTNEKKDEEIEE